MVKECKIFDGEFVGNAFIVLRKNTLETFFLYS